MEVNAVTSMIAEAAARHGITLDATALKLLSSNVSRENTHGGLVELHLTSDGPHAYRVDLRRAIAAALTLGAAATSASPAVILAACAFIAEVGGISVELPREAADILLRLYSLDGKATLEECDEYFRAHTIPYGRGRDVIDALELLRVVTISGQRLTLNDHIIVRQRAPLRLR
jgi:hypothetical protein